MSAPGSEPAVPVARAPLKVAIWGLVIGLAVATTLWWALVARSLPNLRAPLNIPWPILAAGFMVGHFASVRVEFRKQTHTMDLTDVVLLPAIIFSGSTTAILAAVVGTAVISILTREPLVKSAFNLGLHGFVTTAAVVTFHAVLGTDPVLGARGWLGALAAVLVAELGTHVWIQLIIGLAAGSVSLRDLGHLDVMLGSMVAIDTTLGLAAVHLLWTGVGGGLLFVAVAVAVALEYANHGRLRVRHTTLNQLYDFEKALAGIVESESVIFAVLSEALKLFNAEVAQLVLAGEGASICHTLRVGWDQPEISTADHPLVALIGPSSGVLLAPVGSRDRWVTAALAACSFRDAVALCLPTDVASSLEVLVVADRLGGERVTFDTSDVTLAETLATPTAMALRSSDLLMQLRAQVAIKEHQASHDALTGLANRTLFSSEVDRAIAERVPGTSVGIMLIDLDGFKGLNDTLGHEAGDAFLQSVGSSLATAVGARGTVGRLGGDEFAVLVPEVADAADAILVAQRIDSAVRAPVTVIETVVEMRASIGVSVAPAHGEDRFTLLRHADLAMYRAKQHGGGVAVHDDHEDTHIDRPSLIAALREAIQTSTLRLRYQPKVSCQSGEVVGVEALLRWTHPRYGAITPDQFIPVAERTGLIRPLTHWVLETAITQCGAWRQAGLDVNVAVNLSPTQIDDEEILRHVELLLALHAVPPALLTLEITESAALAGDSDGDLRILDALASIGVRLSVDDFGVGTSSLARVKHLPVSEVKIDKSFITHLTSQSVDDAIVGSTVGLAHQLGLEVVAEGVEDEATLAKLRDLGCDIAQGYLVSAPLRSVEVARWIGDRNKGARRMAAGPGREPFARIAP